MGQDAAPTYRYNLSTRAPWYGKHGEQCKLREGTARPYFILTAGIKQHHGPGSLQQSGVEGVLCQGKDLLQGQLSLLVPGNCFHHLIILNVCKGPTAVYEHRYMRRAEETAAPICHAIGMFLEASTSQQRHGDCQQAGKPLTGTGDWRHRHTNSLKCTYATSHQLSLLI